MTRVATLAALMGGAISFAGAAAHAGVVYSTNFSNGVGAEYVLNNVGVNSQATGILGELEGGAVQLTVPQPLKGGAPGSITFDLLGFRTIDHINCCTDSFTLLHNGTALFTGIFALGSPGHPELDFYVLPPGANVSGTGASRTILMPFVASAGSNQFSFSYGQLQGFHDEAWGLDNVSVSVAVAGGVPEPNIWALMIPGFGLVGAALRRRMTVSSAA